MANPFFGLWTGDDDPADRYRSPGISPAPPEPYPFETFRALSDVSQTKILSQFAADAADLIVMLANEWSPREIAQAYQRPIRTIVATCNRVERQLADRLTQLANRGVLSEADARVLVGWHTGPFRPM